MCGIAGVLRFDGRRVDPALIRRMTETLEHRGPDADGFWVDGPVGMGHRRLSIIDLAGSPQPMASPDGRHHLCFNGEILNYQALRTQLSSYPFRTGGDTETILAAYTTDGQACVERLAGQFAFGLFDADRQELLLVRDRMGILPLYYYIDSEQIAFASEIKALLPALPSRPRVDPSSLDDYLASRSVPAPHTMFEGIRKLPAGHLLRVDSSGRSATESYWSVADVWMTQPVPEDEAVDRVEACLKEAVASCLVADVPVGAYLSGGVDSSLIVALMSALRDGGGIETFAAGFADSSDNELPHARRVSKLFATRHHEVMVEPSDFVDLWPRLTWHRDAPMSEPADIAVFRLAELARRQVKVVLSGEGSDELFGGYPKYKMAGVVEGVGLLPAALRRAVVRTVDPKLPPAAARARIALRVLGEATREERIKAWFAPFSSWERAALVGGRQRPRPSAHRQVDGHIRNQMMAIDMQKWLPDNLLERGDRMSMGASLELRPPFLDRNLVELACSVPLSAKVRQGTTKWVVKEVASRYLPAEIVHRRKVGFKVPLDKWFRGNLSDMAADMLLSSDSLIAGFAGREPIERLLNRHRTGQANEEGRLWTLLSLEVWNDVFLRPGVSSGVSSGPLSGSSDDWTS